MADLLQIYSFGSLQIVSNGKHVNGFVSQKTQVLLVYLAAMRSPRPRIVLAEKFFPFSDHDQAATNLRVALNNLRKLMPAYVSVTRSEIGVNNDSTIWLDIAALEEDLNTAKSVAQYSTSFSRTAATLFEHAILLYRGDFLEGYRLDAGQATDSIDSWVESERKRLRIQAVEALDYIVGFYLLEGDYITGASYATRLIQIDPIREKSHYQMMMLLTRAGHTDQALSQYQTYRNILAKKSIHPSSELRGLYEQIRDNPNNIASENSQTRPSVTFVPLREQTSSFDSIFNQVLSQLLNPDVVLSDLLTPEIIKKIKEQTPNNLHGYLLERIAEWTTLHYQLDTRFVRLTLLLDQGETAARRYIDIRRYENLHDVLAEVSSPALVLIGSPGSGKSTLLRRLGLDIGLEGLRAPTDQPIPFQVSLAEYQPQKKGYPRPAPLDWLSGQWKRRYPNLPALQVLLENGHMVLLLDGLNEMPHADAVEYWELVKQWQDFLNLYVRNSSGNRAIFSCRSLDYSIPLSTQEMFVPQVRVEPMDDENIRKFLQVYLDSEARAQEAWKELRSNARQIDLFRSPFFLKMLIDQIEDGISVLQGRAQLFSTFVRLLIKREINHPLLKPESLLTKVDRVRLNDTEVARRNPVFLPDEGLLIPTLSSLAYRMQDTHSGREQYQVHVSRQTALSLINTPAERGHDIIRMGCDLSILELDPAFDQVMFSHQLLQEFFAARDITPQTDAAKWYVEWREGMAQPIPPLANTDMLPPLPGTGWEETTIIAAAVIADAEALIHAVMSANLVLAGRCASQPEVHISEGLKDELRWKLIARSEDSRADLRERIAAGITLGLLGDPRFEKRQGAYSNYLYPPMILIPEGDYKIGSEVITDGGSENPIHQVHIKAFQIGKFPVTNAEYALFIEAGGYDDERWWETDFAKIYRRGDGIMDLWKMYWYEERVTHQKWIINGKMQQMVEDNLYSPYLAEEYTRRAQLDDDEFESWLDTVIFRPDLLNTPRNWHNEAFNNPNQPVSGVSWYEARAYCAWLSAQSGKKFRLPTEIEHEAAARGRTGRIFAYGDNFNVALANTVESHIRRSTPIGIFPGGETPEGVADLAGNVIEWTSTALAPYPYVAHDGREDVTRFQTRRILKGGTWPATYQANGRAASRGYGIDIDRNVDYGFRLAMD